MFIQSVNIFHQNIYYLNNKSRDSPLWSISWAHPRFGSILAVSSFDAEVSIWKEVKTNEWQKIGAHTGHSASVNCVAWAPLDHDLILVSGSSDGNIFKKKNISFFQTGTIIEYRRNNKNDEFIVSKKWQAHESAVNSLSWAQDDEALIIASASSDKSVKVWEYMHETDQYQEKAQLEGHKEVVRDVQWHPQGELLASCSDDGAIIIWRLLEKNDDYTFQIEQEININYNLWRISWSQIIGDKLLVSGYHNGDTSIQVYKSNEEGQLELVQDLDQQQI